MTIINNNIISLVILLLCWGDYANAKREIPEEISAEEFQYEKKLLDNIYKKQDSHYDNNIKWRLNIKKLKNRKYIIEKALKNNKLNKEGTEKLLKALAEEIDKVKTQIINSLGEKLHGFLNNPPAEEDKYYKELLLLKNFFDYHFDHEDLNNSDVLAVVFYINNKGTPKSAADLDFKPVYTFEKLYDDLFTIGEKSKIGTKFLRWKSPGATFIPGQ